MTTQTNYQAQLKKLLADLQDRLATWKHHFEGASTEQEIEYQRRVNQMTQQRNELAHRVSTLPADDTAQRPQIEQAIEDLRERYNRFTSDIKKAGTDSIGWAEGLADADPIESIGWAQGQAEHDPVESKGWAEGQADKRRIDTEGWPEGQAKE